MALVPVADFICSRCHEREEGSGGPFLNLPFKNGKPKCPNCGARRWMERQWGNFSVNVAVRGSAEALPRMTHENIQAIDQLVRPSMEQQQRRRFNVGNTPYEVKAVGMGNVGAEMGKLAGAVGGEQAAAMTAASVQQSIVKNAGKSALDRGEVRAATPAETMVTPPQRQVRVVGKWVPSEREVSQAAEDAVKV